MVSTSGIQSSERGFGFRAEFALFDRLRVELVVIEGPSMWEWSVNLLDDGEIDRFVVDGRSATEFAAKLDCADAAVKLLRASAAAHDKARSLRANA